MCGCVPKSSQETSTDVPVDGAQATSHNDRVSKMNTEIILGFIVLPPCFRLASWRLPYYNADSLGLLVVNFPKVGFFSLQDYTTSQAIIE
jgi:hypothetical protein